MASAFVIGIYFLYRWSKDLTPISLKGDEIKLEMGDSRRIFIGFATFVKIVIAFFVGAPRCAGIIHAQKDFGNRNKSG